MRLYIAPLDFNATVDDIRNLFLPFGEVANVIVPPNHKRPWQHNCGYAFVDMPDGVAARRAMMALNGRFSDGRKLQVEEPSGPSGGR